VFGCLCVFFFSSVVSSSFSFLEFINGVCVLRWMCCGGILAYYVKCTNVVKKWYGSDCVNRGYQGHQGWVSNSKVQTRHPAVMPSVSVITSSEREEELSDFKNMYSPRSFVPPH